MPQPDPSRPCAVLVDAMQLLAFPAMLEDLILALEGLDVPVLAWAHGVDVVELDRELAPLLARCRREGSLDLRTSALAIPPQAMADNVTIGFTRGFDTLLIRLLRDHLLITQDAGALRAYLTHRVAKRQGDGLAGTPERPIDVLLLNTFASVPTTWGGAVRVAGLWNSMPDFVRADSIVAGGNDRTPRIIGIGDVNPGFERQIPDAPRIQATAAELERIAGTNTCHDLAVALSATQGEPLYEAIASQLRSGRYEVVALVHSFLIRQARALAPQLPIIFDAMDVLAHARDAIYRQDPASREIYRQEVALEREACEAATLITCCTEADRQRLIDLYDVPARKVHVVANGVDTRTIPFIGFDRRAALPPTCLFIGSDYPPNIDAARRVVEAARLVPHVRFLIAGRVCDALADIPAPMNVTYIGFMDDAQKLGVLGEATLALNPILTGGGSNLKVAEYAAAGIPIITTEFGARGFSAELQAEMMICDDTVESLAAAISRALSADWSDRTDRARAVVERVYDWRRSAAGMAAAIRAALAADQAWVPAESSL